MSPIYIIMSPAGIYMNIIYIKGILYLVTFHDREESVCLMSMRVISRESVLLQGFCPAILDTCRYMIAGYSVCSSSNVEYESLGVYHF